MKKSYLDLLLEAPLALPVGKNKDGFYCHMSTLAFPDPLNCTIYTAHTDQYPKNARYYCNSS